VDQLGTNDPTEWLRGVPVSIHREPNDSGQLERRWVQPTTFSPFLKNGEAISGASTPMVRR